MRRAPAPLIHAFVLFWTLCALVFAVPASAQPPRVWIDRDRIAYDDTVTLTMEVDLQSTAGMPSLVDLTRDFRIVDQRLEQDMALVNGQIALKIRMQLVLAPTREGTIEIPSLWVGRDATAPLRVTVLPPRNPRVVDEPPPVAATEGRPIFIEAKVDTITPYVQQSVGFTLRLYYQSGMLVDGRLDQHQPAGASLQKIGDDLQMTVPVGGRDYDVVERRYLLIPERSGTLTVPGANFIGRGMGLFDGSRHDLNIFGAPLTLQVRPIPATASQPWLPLRGLRMRYVETPQSLQVGKSVPVTVEVVAEGATAAQLPTLMVQAGNDAQVFAEPPQVDDRFQQDRPQATVVRRFSILPTRDGTLRIVAPRIVWWDTQAGIARIASLPDLTLRVAPGAAGTAAGQDTGDTGTTATASDDARGWRDWIPDGHWGWAGLALGLLWLGALVLGWRLWALRTKPAPVVALAPPGSDPQRLMRALARNDLAAIVQALCAAPAPVAADLDAIRARLADPAQRAAVDALQRARWGDGDNTATLAALRKAFASGPRWRTPAARAEPVLLPPLYPER
ncbi:MAG: protein BatD [Lysobacter sp.]|nr:protein BatD [Lysobacter sp.]